MFLPRMTLNLNLILRWRLPLALSQESRRLLGFVLVTEVKMRKASLW